MHLSCLTEGELLKHWNSIMMTGSFSHKIVFFIHLAYSIGSSKFSIAFWNTTHSKTYLPCNLIYAFILRSQAEYFI